MTVSEIYNRAMAGEQAPVHYIIMNDDRIVPEPIERKYKIDCWSREGRYLKSYLTMTEAANDNGLDVSQVSMNIKGKCRYCKKGTIYFTKSE